MQKESDTNMTRRVALDIKNDSLRPLELHLEPWGDCRQIPPNKTFRIVFDAPELEPVPITFLGDGVVVEGWQESVAEIWCDGELLN